MICWIDVVHSVFPKATHDEAMGLLWEYTGYPTFWATDDHVRECREQLQKVADVRAKAMVA